MHRAHVTGAISELIAQKHFLLAGYQVFMPVVRQGFTDFVIQKDGKYLGVQVKSAYWMKTGELQYLQTRLGKSGGDGVTLNYDGSEDFDLMVIVFENRLWVIPKDELPAGKKTLYLDKTGNRPSKLTYDPKEWEVTNS